MEANPHHERPGAAPEADRGHTQPPGWLRQWSGHSERRARIAVIGAGSWGTTVASMLAEQIDTIVWTRQPSVAEAISARHENPSYLAGFPLARALRTTTDQVEAVEHRQLLVMAVPAQHMRGVAEQLAPLVGPDVVTLSLTKGIEQSTLPSTHRDPLGVVRTRSP